MFDIAENSILPLKKNKITNCMPESFNTNILHQLFKCKLDFVKSKYKNTNSKGDFVLKN